MKFTALLFLVFLILPLHAQKYVLVWGDEFNTPGLPDSTRWDYELGKVRNSELQYYTYRRPENARIEDTVLIIEARKENYKDAQYTSASLISKLKGDWTYGKIEISAKLPTGKGTWPALWMMPTYSEYGGWPKSGEIDIMEYIGVEAEHLFYTAHFEGTNGTGHESSGSGGTTGILHPWEKFINFTLYWTPDSLTWYADGVKYHSYAKTADDYRVWPFNKMFYLILNLAYGGSWGGYAGVDDTKLPHQLLIDYVRVYQLQDGPGPYTLDVRPSNGGTVRVSPEMDTYPEGTQVTLTALPDSEFIFKGWLHLGAANPYTFTLQKDMTVLPFFLRKNEQLTNGSFDTDTYGWSNFVSNIQTGNSELNAQNGELISNVILSPHVNWEVGFQQSGFSLPSGYYRISFDAYAENPASLLVILAKNYGDWGSYFTWSKNLTGDMQHFSFDFHFMTGEENCRLFFGTGNFSGKIFFDNISLVKIDEIPQNITLDRHELSLLQGQKDSLRYVMKNQFGDDMTGIQAGTVIWSVNGDAAELTGNGSFKASGNSDEGWIIASYGDLRDSCHLFVQRISGIQLSPDTLVTDSLRAAKFSVHTIDPDGKPVGIEPGLYSWDVSGPLFGTVDATGWFRGQTDGMTRVYVSLTDFSDSSFVKVECGTEHVFLDSLNEPDQWASEFAGMEDVSLEPSKSRSGLPVFDISYTYACGESGPMIQLSRPVRIYGLPDSLWMEVETGGVNVLPSFRILKHDGTSEWIEGKVLSSLIPVLTGIPAGQEIITDYPLTLTAVKFQIVTDGQVCETVETVSGTIRLRKLMASYPGHAAFFADEPDNTGVFLPGRAAEATVFPNPASERITIHLSPQIIGRPALLQIFSPDGRLFMNGQIRGEQAEINISGWNPGLYILRITTPDAVKNVNLVILHH